MDYFNNYTHKNNFNRTKTYIKNVKTHIKNI